VYSGSMRARVCIYMHAIRHVDIFEAGSHRFEVIGGLTSVLGIVIDSRGEGEQNIHTCAHARTHTYIRTSKEEKTHMGIVLESRGEEEQNIHKYIHRHTHAHIYLNRRRLTWE
jgi:hypothetical protein